MTPVLTARRTRAFILAAGMGTRLRPLTNTVPKCLLPVGGETLLGRWLRAIRDVGVEAVRVNTHWLAGEVDAWLAARPADGLIVDSVHEPKLLGSAGTLLANRDWIAGADRLLVIYGDNFSTADLNRLLLAHDTHGDPLTIGVFRADDPRRCGIVEVDDYMRIQSFVEKPGHPRSNLAAAGLYVLDSKLLDYFPQPQAGLPLDLGFDVFPTLATLGRAVPITGIHLDVGTPESYEMVKQIAARTDA